MSETVKLGMCVAAALAAPHARGGAPRSQALELFLVEGDEQRIKVLDFGVAWQAGLARMTRTGAVVGTPG